ncbi:Plancitoxin-1 [Orchesella cincta]|uniref:Plancitoxin-1 n=1 Tax=Orchesella cincta TaxID=48709 RepID=A0A1D2NGS1_ORCCI|nr:Plancitoxin-1 [Orchesella cincta]
MQWRWHNCSRGSQTSGFSFLVACSFFASIVSTDIAAIPSTATVPPPTLALKCKNEQGKDVDWFIAYKLPKIRTSANPLVRAGLAYAYIEPATFANSSTNTTRDGGSGSVPHEEKGSLSRGHQDIGTTFTATWTLSKFGIDSRESMVGKTVAKLFEKNVEDAAFLTYNDQPPVGPTINSGGHTKGIIVTSLASGFWIQHSVPHFPLITTNYKYSYPETGKINGQVFHCISLPSSEDVDNLGKVLDITKPHIVNYTFPSNSFKTALPQLLAVVNHHHHNSSHLDLASITINPFNQAQQQEGVALNDNELLLTPSRCVNEVDEKACLIEQLGTNHNDQTTGSPKQQKDWDLLEFRSANGKAFHAFAKGPSFNEDIYSAWIAPNYNTKLEVQSWLNGPNPYASNCTLANLSVYNILGKRIAGQEFSTHSDHSKWAVSADDDDHHQQRLVCISDLNRMEHQLKRGGVAVCFMDAAVWATFNSSIIDVQPCPRLLAAAVRVGEISSSLSPPPPLASSSTVNETYVGISAGDGIKVGKSSHGRSRHQKRKVKSRAFSFIAI